MLLLYQVMIVDDESNTLKILDEYVQQANLDFHVIAKAQSAEDALFYLNMASPDLVITDIRMPITDGLALLQQMRQNGWNGYAAILSGYNEFAYAQQAIRLDVFEYILKPVFPDDIAALLSRTRELLNRDQKKIIELRNEIETQFYHEGVKETEGHLPAYLVQAIDYIHQHYAEPLNLTQVAETVSVNPVYLSARFAKDYGINFLEYVTSYRITKAKELLAQTNLQIQEVASQVGYMDIAYFSRVFRRVAGLTPSAFRAEHR